MSVNVVVFQGRIGQDPEMRDVGDQKKTTLRVGSSHYYTSGGEKKEETSWLDVICWGKLAELCKQYCVKGQEVTCVGRISVEQYMDKEGVKKTSTRLVADDVQFGQKPRDKSEATVEASPTSAPSKDVLVGYLKKIKALIDAGIGEEAAVQVVVDNP